MKKLRIPVYLLLLSASQVLLAATDEATRTTAQANRQVAKALSLNADKDFAFAERGLIAQMDNGKIYNSNGSLSVDATIYDWMQGEAPPEVNPSLWRHALLTRIHGLFEVTAGLYQFRGYDVANMTLIRGKTGWIVIDPLFTAASSRAGLKLANKHIANLPVTAVIFTHSHQDHFGGIYGVLPENEAERSKIPIIAPANFYDETLAEHLLAGPHMNRRTAYQAGLPLADDSKNRMSLGLSQVFARGPIESLPATEELAGRRVEKTIDGIEFIFIDAGGTEAPSEFVFYLPAFKALHTAEVVCGVMHNVLTPRGAQVRDTLRWSEVIDSLLVEFGEVAEIQLASHHHPYFGNKSVRNKLINHRNLYRYLHDQTLRLANHGLTMHEIANALPEPQLMATDFSARPYYGNFKHNSRAVYQHYFGWWGGVPATLDPLPPEELGVKYVALMGGAEQVLSKAKQAFKQGDYRFAAAVLNHLVFADAANEAAKTWLAKTYRQLGYQEESGIFRNIYLAAAYELQFDRKGGSIAVQHKPGIPLQYFGNLMAVRFNPEKFAGRPFKVQFHLSDLNKTMSFDVGRDVLYPRVGAMGNADFSISLSQSEMEQWFAGELETRTITRSRKTRKALHRLRTALDHFAGNHPIVKP